MWRTLSLNCRARSLTRKLYVVEKGLYTYRTFSSATPLSGVRIQQKLGESRSREYKVNQLDGRLEKCKKEVPLNVKLLHAYENTLSYFLPKGYPTSVGTGYKYFALGQMTSVVLSTAGGVLSMQALLTAIGVGSSKLHVYSFCSIHETPSSDICTFIDLLLPYNKLGCICRLYFTVGGNCQLGAERWTRSARRGHLR
jgi:hypothetical protein